MRFTSRSERYSAITPLLKGVRERKRRASAAYLGPTAGCIQYWARSIFSTWRWARVCGDDLEGVPHRKGR